MFGQAEFKLQFCGDRELFDEIIFLARTKNQKKLSALLLSSRVCIDVHYKNQTPASFLAETGDEASATFLLNNGASLKYIVQGAIRGKHDKFLEKLITYGANEKDIQTGYTQIGAIDKIKELKSREVIEGMPTCTNIKAFFPFLIEQFHTLNQEKPAESIEEQEDDLSARQQVKNAFFILSAFLSALAFTNDLKTLKSFIQFFINQCPDYLPRGVIFSAALAHHTETIDYLLNLGVNPRIGFQGAALGGHPDLIQRFCQMPAYLSPGGRTIKHYHHGLLGGGLGGHIDLLNELMPHASEFSKFFFYSMRGAAQGDHLPLVQQLYTRLVNIGRITDPGVLKRKLSASRDTIFERELSFILRYAAIEEIIKNGHLQSAQAAQQFLRRIPSQAFRIVLASAIDQFRTSVPEKKLQRLTPHLPLAAQFDTQPRGLSFASALCYQHVEKLLANMPAYFIKFVTCLVTQYLAPYYLTDEETFKLIDKIYSPDRSKLKFPVSAQRHIFSFFSSEERKNNRQVCTSWSHLIKDFVHEETRFRRDSMCEFTR